LDSIKSNIALWFVTSHPIKPFVFPSQHETDQSIDKLPIDQKSVKNDTETHALFEMYQGHTLGKVKQWLNRTIAPAKSWVNKKRFLIRTGSEARAQTNRKEDNSSNLWNVLASLKELRVRMSCVIACWYKIDGCKSDLKIVDSPSNLQSGPELDWLIAHHNHFGDVQSDETLFSPINCDCNKEIEGEHVFDVRLTDQRSWSFEGFMSRLGTRCSYFARPSPPPPPPLPRLGRARPLLHRQSQKDDFGVKNEQIVWWTTNAPPDEVGRTGTASEAPETESDRSCRVSTGNDKRLGRRSNSLRKSASAKLNNQKRIRVWFKVDKENLPLIHNRDNGGCEGKEGPPTHSWPGARVHCLKKHVPSTKKGCLCWTWE
jgi:hypothetical protein